MNIIFIRIYRLWFKFYASTERLRDAASPSGSTLSYESSDGGSNPNIVRNTQSNLNRCRSDSFSISISRSSITSMNTPKAMSITSGPSSVSTVDSPPPPHHYSRVLSQTSSMANTPRSTVSTPRKSIGDPRKLQRVETLRKKVINPRKSSIVLPKPEFTMTVHNPELLLVAQGSGTTTPAGAMSMSGFSTPSAVPDDVENPETASQTSHDHDIVADPMTMSRTVPLGGIASVTAAPRGPPILVDSPPMSPKRSTKRLPLSPRRYSSGSQLYKSIIDRGGEAGTGAVGHSYVDSPRPPLRSRRPISRAATVRVKPTSASPALTSASRPSSPRVFTPPSSSSSKRPPTRVATSTTSSRETTDPHSHTITTVTTTTVTQETTIRLSNRDRDRHGSLSLSVRGQGGHQGGHQHEPYSGGVGNGAYAPDLERIASERDFFEEKFNDEYTKDCELEMSDLKHESTKEDVPSSRPKEEQSLKKDRGLSLLRVSPKAWFVSRRRYARTWFLLAMILVSSVVVFGAVFVPLLVETSAFMDTLPTQTCSWVGYSSWIVRCSSGKLSEMQSRPLYFFMSVCGFYSRWYSCFQG